MAGARQGDKGPRACTDVACCLFFTFCCGLFGAVCWYAFAFGDPYKYISLPDWQGNFCGVGAPVVDRPYLYFCQDDSGRLNYTTPICLASCPDPAPGIITQTQCPRGVGVDYPSRIWGGLLCMPRDHAVIRNTAGAAVPHAQMIKDVAKATFDNPTISRLMEIAEIPKAWQPLAISGVSSIMLALAYLTFLDKAAFCLLWAGIALLIVIPGTLGGYFLYCAQNGGADGLPSTGDSKADVFAGLICFAISLAFFCVAFCVASSVDKAIDAIKASAECVREMPTLLFQPLLVLCFKLPTLIFLVYGFCYLASVVHQISEEEFSTVTGYDTSAVHEYLGTYVTLEYDHKEYVFLAFYGIMCVWILEIMTAMSSFMVSYATQSWFFSYHRPSYTMSRSTPCLGTCEGLLVGLRYHLGTFAFGALIITVVRLPRLVFGLVSRRNPLLQSDCVKVIQCCLDCYERWLRYMHKAAYMQVAMHGDNFCNAAWGVMEVLYNEATTASIMHGATWIFQLTGLGGITAGGAYITYLMVTHMPVYSSPESEYYIQDPLFLVLVASWISFSVAMPFMLIFGQVSDTILFCFAADTSMLSKDAGFATMLEGGDGSRAPGAMGLLSHARRG